MNNLFASVPTPHPELAACVIVPAKNEVSGLERTLAALAAQVELDGRPVKTQRWEIFLLINNSSDDSFALAMRFREARPWLPLHVAECHFDARHAHIGHVRKILMDLACTRLASSRHHDALILSTDADTEVAPDWVAQNWAEARRGAEAIGGRISLHVDDVGMFDSQTRQIQHLNDQYHLLTARLEDVCDPQSHDPWPRHHQHFGASLAVRPMTYRQVGGVPPRKSLEDVAFYEALLKQDVRFRHSPSVSVSTSGRLQGRTEIGLAEQLSRWCQGPPKVMVPSVKFHERFFSIRRRVRILWERVRAGELLKRAAVENLASACGSRTDLVLEALECEWFGTAFEVLGVRQKLETGPLQTQPFQLLPNAVDELRMRFCTTRPLYSKLQPEAAQSGIAAL